MTILEAFELFGLSASFRQLAEQVKQASAGAGEMLLSGWKRQVLTPRYRELALLHHPDRGGDPALMARLNLAYELLQGFKLTRTRKTRLRISRVRL